MKSPKWSMSSQRTMSLSWELIYMPQSAREQESRPCWPSWQCKKEHKGWSHHWGDEASPTKSSLNFFCKHKEPWSHNTWTHPATKEHYQLNHFLIKWRYLQLITNVRRKSNWAPSDHAVICIELKFLDRKWIPKKNWKMTIKKILKMNNHILRAAGQKHSETRSLSTLIASSKMNWMTFQT